MNDVEAAKRRVERSLKTVYMNSDGEYFGVQERMRKDDVRIISAELDRRAAAIENLALWAVRYAVGRMTYVTGLVGETIIANRDLLSANTRANILRAVEEAPSLGHDCDIAEWDKVVAALRENEAHEGWTCNECGAREFTSSVSAGDLQYLACSACGGNEFHRVTFGEEGLDG